jgi:hypothetical protein
MPIPNVRRSCRKRSRSRLTPLTLFALAAIGCARHEARPPAPSAVVDSVMSAVPFVDSAQALQPSPPQPSGPPIGRRDALANASAPALEEWVAMWAAALPGFAIDSTWAAGRERWTPLYTKPFAEDPLSAPDTTFQILGLPSPDGQHVLDVDAYQQIHMREDVLVIGGEPDSQSGLIDTTSHGEAILQVCGTVCGFHWGTWLSPTSFALGGWRDADDAGHWKQGQLWIYSIPDSSVAEYQTRIVSVDAFARYEAAWKAWLLKRYRAFARAHQGT